jgi:NADH dehydrogenase
VAESTDVLVVGGGFGGSFAAQALEHRVADRGVSVSLIAPENFLLFSPNLPEAASGTIEPRHAVIPLRDILRHTRLVSGDVKSIDHEARTVSFLHPSGEQRQIAYRTLVLSPGSVPTTFPIPGLKEHAVGFKTLADAIWLRNRILHQLEVADSETDVERRHGMLTFTFVGGGYAGVEALAELESLVNDALRRYPRLDRSQFRWVLVEARDRLLPGLSPRLASYTERELRRRGIELRLSTKMTSCVGCEVVLSDERVAPYRSDTIVWTAGQRPSPLVASLGLPLDDSGRLLVDEHLRVRGVEGMYAVGDAAAVPSPEGGAAPGTAQHALREGRRCGQNVAADYGVGHPRPFDYRTRGLAVTLGRGKGTAQVKQLTFTGWPAWWMGRSYHLLMIPGLARKARVVGDWTIAILFPRDIAQLGTLGRPSPLA